MSAMYDSETTAGRKTIACETCERMGRDDGNWSRWTTPAPESRTYYVCHQCFSSPRTFWRDLFSLCQKSGVGTVQLARDEQSIVAKSEESCISCQQPEDNLQAEQYHKLEDTFRHSSLDHDQVRLLSILPGTGDVLCTIENVDLDSEVGRYEALSYCWGTNEQPKKSIWINGYPFEVFSSLYAALTQLRRPKSTRRLWIDAICINQIPNGGEAEKNTQIPLMGKIYHQAASVVIWLGAAESDYDSDKTLDVVYHQNVGAMQSRKFATNFGRLLKRPWFRRTWIVQEFVLGKTLPQIMCGSRSVSFGKFMATHWVLPLLMNRFPDMDFVQLRKIVDSDGNVVSSKLFKRKLDFVWRNHDEMQSTLIALTNIREIVTDNDARLRPKPLYKILPLVKAFGVTDRKDKIYGVFGMVSPSVHESVQVDYRKTVAEVYRDTMTYMLRAQDDEPGAVELYLNIHCLCHSNHLLPTCHHGCLIFRAIAHFYAFMRT